MNASLWQLAGWTMIHSLWIGAAVALTGGFLRLTARRATPSTRYAISLATLAALAISPIAAAAWLSVNGVPQLATVTPTPLLPPLPLGEGWGEGEPAANAPQFANTIGSDQIASRPAHPLLHPSLTLPIEGRGPEDRRVDAPAPLVIDLAHSDPSPRYSGERLGEGQNLRAATPFAAASVQSDTTVENPSPNRSANSTALRSLATGDRAQLLPSLPGRGIPAPLPTDHQPPITAYITHLAPLIPYLPILWLVGAPLTFTLLAAGLVGSERLRRRATPLVAGPAFDACQRMRTALRITRRVALAACDGVAQPVLVGVFRPLILLPTAALAGWTPEQLDMILLHELAHVRRWDNLVNLLQRIVESPLFYHPAVWILSRQVRHDREECCDATVIRHTDRPHQYAELLVSIAAALRGGPAPSLAVASAMASHPLAGRIRRILNIEAEPMRITRRTLAATLLLPALLACAILYSGANAEDAATGSPGSQNQGGAATGSNEPQPPAITSEEGTSVSPPNDFDAADSQNISELLKQINEAREKVLAAREELNILTGNNRPVPPREKLVQEWFDLHWKDDSSNLLHQEQGDSIRAQIEKRKSQPQPINSAVIQQLETALEKLETEHGQYKAKRLARLESSLADASVNELEQIAQALNDEKVGEANRRVKNLENQFNTLAFKLRNSAVRNQQSAPQPAAPTAINGQPDDNDAVYLKTHPLDQFPENVDMRRWMEIVTSDPRIDIQWEPAEKRFVVAAPKSGHEQFAALLAAAREQKAAEPELPTFKPILTHNLSDKDSAPLIGGYGILQEFPANAPQSAVDAVVNRLKADNRRFSVEQSVDGRRRIVDQTPSPEMEVLREIRQLESLVTEAKKEEVNLEVFKQLAVQDASSPALTEQAIAQELEKDQTLKTLNDRLLNIDRFVASEESHLADDATDRDRETIDNLIALRKATAAKRDAYRAEAVEKLRERIAKMPNETLRSAIIEYQVRRKAVDEKLAKHQEELDAARHKLSQLGVDSPPAQPQPAANASPPPSDNAETPHSDVHLPTLQSEVRNLETLVAKAQEEVVNLDVYKQSGGHGTHPGSSELDQAIAKEMEQDPTVNELRQKLFEQQTQLQTQLAESKNPNSTAIKQLRSAVQLTEAELAKYSSKLEKSLREELAHIPAEAKTKVEADYNLRYQAAKDNLAKYQQELGDARQQLSQLGASAPPTSGAAAPHPALQPLLTPEDNLKKTLTDTRQRLADRLAELKEQSADDLQKIRAGEVPASREEDESSIALREKIQAMSEARLKAEEGPASSSPVADAVSKSYPADKVRPINAEKFSQVLGSSALVVWDLQNRTLTVNAPEQVHARIAELLKIDGRPAPPRSDKWLGGKIRTTLAADSNPEALQRAFQQYERNGADVVAIPHDDGSMSIVDATPEYTASRREGFGGMAGPASAPTGAVAPAADVQIQQPEQPADLKEIIVRFIEPFPDSAEERERIRKSLVADGFAATTETIDGNGARSHALRLRVPGDWYAKPVWETLADGSKTLRIVNDRQPASAKLAPPASPFPTLEHQRLADRAYKLLGLELEPLNPQELERVKKLGYTSGLRITRANQMAGTDPDDLLVGLHVWPITDLKSLDEVLQRDDLGELNPLKYYVIRKKGSRLGRSPYEDDGVIVTGRLHLLLNAKDVEERTIAQPTQPRTVAVSSSPTIAIIQPPTSTASGVLDRGSQTTAYLKVIAPRVFNPHQRLGADVMRHYEAQLRLLRSKSFLQQVISSKSVAELPTVKEQDDSITWLQQRLQAHYPGKGEILELRLEGGVAAEDEAVLQAVIEQFIEAMEDLAGSSDSASIAPGYPKQDAAATSSSNYDAPPASVALKPGDVIILKIAGAFPEQPIDGLYRVEPEGTLPLGPTYGRVAVAGKTALEAEAAIQAHLSTILTDAKTQLTLGDSSQPAASSEPTFLYDGKTFEQWRDLWKNELNPERRADAIGALSAFSRAGRSDDAINAILDVAAEYDFSYPDDSHNQGEEKLKERIVEELTVPDDFNQPRDPWIPLLLKRMARDPEKWQKLAQRLYHRMGPPYRGNRDISPQNLELLKRCAADPAFGPNVDMLTMLHWSTPDDEELKQLVKETLTAKDTTNALALLRNLGFGHLDEFPEQLDFLFNADAEIRKTARTTLNWVSSREQYEAVIPKLLAILDDPDQSTRHADAIRALAAIAMRNNARGGGPPLLTDETHTKVAERMGTIFSDGPPELLPPAFIALQFLMEQNQEQFLQFAETQFSEDRMTLLKEAVKALPAEMKMIIAPPPAANRGLGGGGMSGGAGGGFF